MAIVLITVLCILLAGGGSAWAAGNPVIVDVNAGIAASAQLTISPLTINFPDANPDTTPSVSAMENPVTVMVNAQTGNKKNVTLTVLAQGDLVSGADTIPISNVRWTATGTGFVPGVFAKNVQITAGSWVGSGTRSGSFAFFLANSWNYVRGNYQATVTYTLTAP